MKLLRIGQRVACTTGAIADPFTALRVVARDPEVDAYDVALEEDPDTVFPNVDRSDLRPIA